MARDVKQFRYYGPNNKNNQPRSDIDITTLSNGTIFFNDGGNSSSIVQLGIQTLPGVKFYLNNGIDPIYIGSTGIYELDLSGLADITALSFDQNSLKQIDESIGAYLIVDAIYELEEE